MHLQTSMKKLLLLFTIFFIITVAQGQTNVYHPFPDSAYWRVDYEDILTLQYPYHAYSYFNYSIAGDTMINGYVHKKINRSYVDYNLVNWTPPYNPPAPPTSGYIGALKDDSLANKTFFVFPNSNTDSLLYDYNLAVGDTIKGFITQYFYTDYNNIAVLSIDSVLISAQYRKRWNALYNSDSIYIIEGIGSSVGLIEPFYTYAVDFRYRHLVCLNDSSGILFSSNYNSAMGCNLIEGVNEINSENKVNCYPNPFSTQTTLQTNKFLNDAILIVYNSLGQQVKQINNISGHTIIFYRDNLPSGLYFMCLTQDNKIITTEKLVITDY